MSNEVKNQVRKFISQANYNRNTNGLLSPDDADKAVKMIDDIELKINELHDVKAELLACQQAGEPAYS